MRGARVRAGIAAMLCAAGAMRAAAPAAAQEDQAGAEEPAAEANAAGSTAARAGATLTLAEVLRSVDASHPLLVAAAQERPIAEAELQSAEGAFDMSWRTRATAVPLGGYQTGRVDSVVEVPTPVWGTSLFAGYRWGSQTFPVYDQKLETNALGEVRAGALVPLWRNGPVDRRRASIDRAEIGIRLADLTVAEQRIQLARLASLRYWDWVAAARKLAVAADVLGIAEQRDAQLADRVASGDLPEIERVDNQRAILQRRQQVVSAQRGFEQAALELALYFRDRAGKPLPVPLSRAPASFPEPTPPPAAPEAEVRAALSRRPELERLRGQREQARIERDWADNQRMPAIDLAVTASQDIGRGDPKRQPFELETSILIDIPLERNVANGRMRAAQAQIGRIQAQQSFAADRVATDVKDALSALSAAFDRVRVARSELTVARRLEQAERDRFTLGDSSLLFVNLREQQTLDAAVREIDALADYHRARAALEAATAARATAPQR